MAPRRTMTNTKKMAGFSAAAVATVALFGCSDDDNGKKEETCADQTGEPACTTFGTDDCEWTEALCNVVADLDFTANDGELCKALFDDAAFVTIPASCVHPCASVDRQPTPLTFAPDNTATGSWDNSSDGARCNGTVERTFTEGTFTLTGVNDDANCGSEGEIYTRAELEGLDITDFDQIDFETLAQDGETESIQWTGTAEIACAATLAYTADTNVFTYDLAVIPADGNCDDTAIDEADFLARLPAANAADGCVLDSDTDFTCQLQARVDRTICVFATGDSCTETTVATCANDDTCVVDPERYECNGDLSTISCEDTDAFTCELKVDGGANNTANVCVFQAGECTDAPVIETKSCAVNGDFGFDEEVACIAETGCSWVEQECQTDAVKITESEDACTSAGGAFTEAECVDLCGATAVSRLEPSGFPGLAGTLTDVFFNVNDDSGGRCEGRISNIEGFYSTDVVDESDANCINVGLNVEELLALVPMSAEEDSKCASAVAGGVCQVSQTAECEAPEQTCGAADDETTCQTLGVFANCQFTQATCNLPADVVDPCLAADLATCITANFFEFCSAAGDQVCEGTYEVVV